MPISNPQVTTPNVAISTKEGAAYRQSYTLRFNALELTVHLPQPLWTLADKFGNVFLEELQSRPPSVAVETQEELWLSFMHFMTIKKFPRSAAATNELLANCLSHFHDKYLQGSSPVVVFSKSVREEALPKSLSQYFAVLNRVKMDEPYLRDFTGSALFSAAVAGQAQLVAAFGGQALASDLIGELSAIVSAFQPIVQDALTLFARTLKSLAEEEEFSAYANNGLDIMSWLSVEPENRPDNSYVLSAPISFPMIGLIQLLNLLVLLHTTGVSFEEFKAMLKFACGHSQGLAIAAVLACSGSQDELLLNGVCVLKFLFSLGARAQQTFPFCSIDPVIISDSVENGEGAPSPMLAVSGLPLKQVEAQVAKVNAQLQPKDYVQIALVNGAHNVVCAGPIPSLHGLCLVLRRLQASAKDDQSRVPFSERKADFKKVYLQMSAPFHSTLLQDALPLVLADVQRYGWHIETSSGGGEKPLAVPSSRPGATLDFSAEADLFAQLARLILVEPVDWPSNFTEHKGQFTHVLDFGPGANSGIAGVTLNTLQGTQASVMLANSLVKPLRPEIASFADLHDNNPATVQFAQSWESLYRPRLVRTKYDGTLHLETRFSRLLGGKPPLMIAGMTPCTVNEHFVSAVMDAGYHIEIAGGGHHSERSLRKTINAILEKVPAGAGVTVNTLFINPKQWGFQFPLVQVLRREGYPIDGFTIAAGVPSLDNATEIIRQLQSAGIRHVSFKPGSVESIYQVIAIARANPTASIVLQWTGGRAGGHHSFEDFHAPVLSTYAAIRATPNVFLVAGSGFGDAQGIYPYLTGEWSLAYNFPKMPFDGFLMGSRVMVALECLTARPVKDVIVGATGVANELDWVKSYKASAGGVITVRSELGEPIHKIATRGVLLWKELDDKVFSLPRAKRGAALLANKAYWIARLNKDFQKVWFGSKADGTACELEEMTYEEVARRVAELLFIKDRNKWIDPSHCKLLLDYLRSVEERFVSSSAKKGAVSIVPALDAVVQNDAAVQFLDTFFAAFSAAGARLLNPEDAILFVNLCQRPGQKPVTFIPVMDDNFETWFKKDSLWQSEDIDAVYDKDPQRVCILQGPVAIKYCTEADTPVKAMLDGIKDGLIEKVLNDFYGGDASAVPLVECLDVIDGPINAPLALESAAVAGEESADASLLISKDAPAEREGCVERKVTRLGATTTRALSDALCFGSTCWLSALISSSTVVSYQKLAKNPYVSIFTAQGKSFFVTASEGVPVEVEVYDADEQLVLTAAYDSSCRVITVSFFYTLKDVDPLVLRYEYSNRTPFSRITELSGDRVKAVKRFYWNVWFDDASDEAFSAAYEQDPRGAVYECTETVNAKAASDFCRVIRNYAPIYTSTGSEGSGPAAAPLDFAIVTCWRAVCQPLFSKFIDGDLIKLVHLSNSFTVLQRGKLMQAGDKIRTVAKVKSIVNEATGKAVEVEAIAYANDSGEALIQLNSKFFYRGKFEDHHQCFTRIEGEVYNVTLASDAEVAVFKAKPWVSVLPGYEHLIQAGSKLRFTLNVYSEPASSGAKLSKLEVAGRVQLETSFRSWSEVARVAFSNDAPLQADPVHAYLDKRGSEEKDIVLFANGGHSIVSKTFSLDATEIITNGSNALYSKLSGDHNPVHTSPLFADLAELPGTITHGMWTSAAVRAIVENFSTRNNPLQFVSYEAKFTDMVLPGQKLTLQLKHVGMQNGRKLISVQVLNGNGDKVLDGTAKVEPETTAVIFTGQGSQEMNMGMELYKSSAVAKQVWDSADQYMNKRYGFSLLEIVRTNPKTKTVFFRGEKGAAIRDTYMRTTFDEMQEDGSAVTKRLFPTIDAQTDSYTFFHPDGLLFATQFAQPAITIMELAAFEDMRAKGLVLTPTYFAGHSLGEYAALAAVGRLFSSEVLCDLVFYRGITMHNVVKRNASGGSAFGMVAVNPSRIGGFVNDATLKLLVARLATLSTRLIEIVNYNIEDQQYVVAGHLTNLYALGKFLDHVKRGLATLAKDVLAECKSSNTTDLSQSAILSQIMLTYIHESAELFQRDGTIAIERGAATIPLRGIDVPFHSSYLLGGVSPFREFLAKNFTPAMVDVRLLKHSYVPNLVATPFDTTREYVQLIHKASKSANMEKLLASWDEQYARSPEGEQAIAHALVIELLAYQFASAVQWIATQDVFFRDLGVKRLIEVGPAYVLGPMAERTLKTKYLAFDTAHSVKRSVFGIPKDRSEVYYEFDAEEDDTPAAAPVAAAAAPVAAPAAAPVAAARPAAGAISSLNLPTAVQVQVMIASKLRRDLSEIPLSKSIKEISAGKSTVQNEIVGDLQKEFGGAMPEKPEELPLSELGGAIGQKPVAKLLAQSANKLFASKMPAGFSISAAKGVLAKDYGVSADAADAVLAFSVGREPASRLKDAAEATAWLGEAANAVFSLNGVSAAPAGAGTAPAAAVAAAAPVASRPAGSIASLSLPTAVQVQVMVAAKLRKALSEIPLSKSIKEISAGKSTVQNEIVGDLQKEYGGALPEKPEDLPLAELGAAIGQKPIAKSLSQSANKLFASKMPAGFTVSAAKAALARDFGVSADAADAVLAFSVGREPASRLKDAAEATAWLGEAANAVFALNGVSASSGGASGGVAAGAAGAAFSSEEVDKIMSKNYDLARRQAELLASYLGQNPHAALTQLAMKDSEIAALQAELDVWMAEHGQIYADGVKPIFSKEKARVYDSWWNWSLQELTAIFFSFVLGEKKSVEGDEELRAKAISLVNRADEKLVHAIAFLQRKADEKSGESEGYALAKQFLTQLAVDVQASVGELPRYKDASTLSAPSVQVKDDGSIVYHEIPRESSKTFAAYVEEMKTRKGVEGSERVLNPLVFLSHRTPEDPAHWCYSEKNSGVLYGAMQDMALRGVSFAGRNVLMTGCGKGSIGAEILKGLLAGGASVVVTTSSFNKSTTQYFRSIYEAFGAKQSRLVLVPFNQGSNEDVKALMDYIYAADGLGWDLDYVVPFGAISENGREISDVDSKSELAHRLMLTNVVRLIGQLVNKKRSRNIDTRSAQVILPLSPNHGVFGGDGLYAESKIALETLLNKWSSESWRSYVCVVGAVIGWTRGTGLMSENNMISQEIEALGCRTFSPAEMAFNVLSLMHPAVFTLNQFQPLWADLSGHMNTVDELHIKSRAIRERIRADASIKRAVHDEAHSEKALVYGAERQADKVTPKANLNFDFLPLKKYETLTFNPDLRELLNLDRTVVVAGFGEMGPWGNSRTRWEMESQGEFSVEGCITMAWMVGLIKFHNGRVNGSNGTYCGWVDAKSGEPVRDADIKERYEAHILAHSGIRVIEPEAMHGYNPEKKTFYREVVIEQDMQPIEVSAEEAQHFLSAHGDKVDVFLNDDKQSLVKFKRGTTLYIPKALRVDRLVAGLVPTGWEASKYGVPKEMIGAVDDVTLYVLVSTVEALVNAGITDPYELYEYVHVTEVGNTSGGGAGGGWAQHKYVFERYFEKPVQSDILQEFFINTMPAWVNMLLLSSSGPIKTPVGACASAVESLDVGVETILSGKARVVVVGGYDAISEESSYEFGSMSATSNTLTELAAGREPSEMSRPTTSTRSGFMESEGAGIQILMTARLALDMGVPIYGVVAATNTATDKEGRSVPAPGQGILTTARRVNVDSVKGEKAPRARALDIKYRVRQLRSALTLIDAWRAAELKLIADELSDGVVSHDAAQSAFYEVELEAQRRVAHEKRLWGHEFFQSDPRIAPIEGALATFGLTVDDVGVGSFHGTSTKANDFNESSVLDAQLAHLGRTPGALLPCVFQKHLTGHPKGAAAAWMLNGALQAMATGLVPGNRNADNIDVKLAQFSNLLFLSRPLQTSGIKAAMLKSFGFGQASGEAVVVHADCVLSTLTAEEYALYAEKRSKREARAARFAHRAMLGSASSNTLMQAKTAPPYADDLESKVYLNPLARAGYDAQKNTWIFDKKSVDVDPAQQLFGSSKLCSAVDGARKTLAAATAAAAAAVSGTGGAGAQGVDVQLIAEIARIVQSNETFVARNFTAQEIAYCGAHADPASSFAGRWAAKEAVAKALHHALDAGLLSLPAGVALPQGASLPLNDVEILPKGSGNALPVVTLYNDLARVLAQSDAQHSIQVSISHSGEYAVAIAQIVKV